MEKSQAKDYLTSLINKTLRIRTTDTRTFIGTFKCTDSDRNIILSRTHEYRHPSPSAVTKVAISASPSQTAEKQTPTVKVKIDMTSRYLGLVVVPGQYISKIEVEEFASQVKGGVGVI